MIKGKKTKASRAKQDQTLSFETALNQRNEICYTLRLYVTGTTPLSSRAIANIKTICEEHLRGRYNLEVIDLYKNPYLAAGEQIIAAPTLVKQLPLPLRKIIGDLSNTERVLVGLDLKKSGESEVRGGE